VAVFFSHLRIFYELKEPTVSIEALFIPHDGSPALDLRGTRVAFKAKGQRAGNGPTFIEFTAAPGFSTGDHVHTKVEELFYVLQGEFLIRAGDRADLVGPGDFVQVPPNVAHGFGNSGSTPATLALVISPAAVHEAYFEELAQILARPGPPDAELIADLRRRYDTVQVSPLVT
jgi:quercetin dioxygenase-like cupin family protein